MNLRFGTAMAHRGLTIGSILDSRASVRASSMIIFRVLSVISLHVTRMSHDHFMAPTASTAGLARANASRLRSANRRARESCQRERWSGCHSGGGRANACSRNHVPGWSHPMIAVVLIWISYCGDDVCWRLTLIRRILARGEILQKGTHIDLKTCLQSDPPVLGALGLALAFAADSYRFSRWVYFTG